MILKKIRLRNYKSFDNSDWVALGPRLNRVVGQNNSGKTAFLEALNWSRFTSKPIHHFDAFGPVIGARVGPADLVGIGMRQLAFDCVAAPLAAFIEHRRRCGAEAVSSRLIFWIPEAP